MIIIIILRIIIMLLMLLFSPTPDLLNWMSHSTEGRIVFDYIAQTHSPSNRRTSVKVDLSCTESLYMYT